jgi:polar amino acid transport system substrate-binding protein
MPFTSQFCVLLLALLQLSAHAETLKLVTYHFPPYSVGESDNPATPSGPLVTLVREICKAAAVECDIEIVPWLRAQEYLRVGRADGIFPITPNPAWNDRITYTEPVAIGEYGVFVPQSNHLMYRVPADLQGMTIAVQGPSNMSSVLEQLQQAAGNITIERRPDVESGFRKLAIGRVDGVFANRALGEAVIMRLNERGLRYAGTTTRIAYSVGFSSTRMEKDTVLRFSRMAAELGAKGRISQIMSTQTGTAPIAPKPK